MRTSLDCLRLYVGEMKRQMVLFNSVNRRMLKACEGRMVRVSPRLGSPVMGFLEGFGVDMPADAAGGQKPSLYVRLRLPRRDGSPGTRVRQVCIEGAAVRFMGSAH